LKLAALARRGWFVRARRGLYLLLPLEAEPGNPSVAEDPWILAREAFAPCYVGGWSAAEHWGLTEQLFHSTLVVTGANVRARSARLLGHEFRLFRVPSRRVDGAVLVWRGAERVAVSDRERTLVDGLRQPALCGGFRHVVQMMSAYGDAKERDIDKLIATAKKHGSGATWKRLGYLAEVLWPDETRVPEEARRRVTKGNVRLDPAIKRPGRLLRRWGVFVNVTVSSDEPKARA
jgi:predicted transcriptional regulator of viral defense system